jgi:hypothetical protein
MSMAILPNWRVLRRGEPGVDQLVADLAGAADIGEVGADGAFAASSSRPAAHDHRRRRNDLVHTGDSIASSGPSQHLSSRAAGDAEARRTVGDPVLQARLVPAPDPSTALGASGAPPARDDNHGHIFRGERPEISYHGIYSSHDLPGSHQDPPFNWVILPQVKARSGRERQEWRGFRLHPDFGMNPWMCIFR